MARSSRRDKPATSPDRVLRTFLFSDMVQSTAIRDACVRRYGNVAGNEKYRLEVLEPHDRRLREHFKEFFGAVHGPDGDSYFVVFRDARHAVQCAVAIQDSLATHPIAITGVDDQVPRRVQVRIGMHTGTAVQIERGGGPNYDDHTINIARRIQECAGPDQILTSRDTWKDAGEIGNLRHAEYGGYELQGVQETWTLVEIVRGGREPSGPPPRAGATTALMTLDRLREDYFVRLAADHEWLSFAGIPQVRNIVCLKLDDVFVPLSVTREPSEGDLRYVHRMIAARLGDGETAGRRIALADALQEPCVVVLGEPGAGKTTILKHVALTLAKRRGSELGLGAEEATPLPILFPVSAYAAALRRADRALSDYLPEYFAAHEQPGLAPLFADGLARGRAIVLLDGLDEVLDAGERVQMVRRIHEFVRRYSSLGNRFVVTSRIAGYETARLDDFVHITVLPFDADEVERFCSRWSRAWERVTGEGPAADARADRRARDLAEAIEASESVGRLATNPLLLTIIALIHYQNVRLPERRVEVYRLAIEALAESWNLARSLGGQAVDLNLGDRRLDARFVVNVLGPVARWVHANQPGGMMEQGVLEAKLAETLREHEGVTETRARELAYAFVDLIRRGSGLLQERGTGLYSFLHLMFEEYLAARAIADLDPHPAMALLEHWADASWREVVLLAVASSVPAQASRLIEALLGAAAAGHLRGKNVVLAGQALVDAGREGTTGTAWQKTINALVSLVEERDPVQRAAIKTRAEAAQILGLLGDPRIANDAWVEVPAGEFLIGTSLQAVAYLTQHGGYWEEFVEELFEREAPQQQLTLGPFRVGKWPVTNQEFRRFIEAGGYETREHWSEAGWTWLHRSVKGDERGPTRRGRGERTEQALRHHFTFGGRHATHPVVGVTWYEAQAYCRWLTERLRLEGRLGLNEIVTLPSEAEWEKAARGANGREWPWGDQWDPKRANTREEGIATTTAVGIYLDGASQCHALDMAGNVWEWTRTLYRRYPYRSDDGRDDPDASGGRCVRGGAWDTLGVGARSACRLEAKPDLASSVVGFRSAVVPVHLQFRPTAV